MNSTIEIALFEDNSADVFLVRYALQKGGVNFNLQVLSDGDQAVNFLHTLETTSADCPDLLLVDLNLPKLRGTEVIERVRKLERCADLPIVVLTSSTSTRDREQVAILGVDHYFVKSVDLEEFFKLGPLVQSLVKSLKKSLVKDLVKGLVKSPEQDTKKNGNSHTPATE